MQELNVEELNLILLRTNAPIGTLNYTVSKLVEDNGVEPLTFCVQSRRSSQLS